LKAHQKNNEATPMEAPSESISTDPVNTPSISQPDPQFYHCLGKVGGDGNVSSLAMNHFVDLVQLQARQWAKSLSDDSIERLAISVALAPSGKKRIEFDRYPQSITTDDLEHLHKQIDALKAPVIFVSPVAFAFYFSFRRFDEAKDELLIFPSLAPVIKTVGLEAAICEAFGMMPNDDQKTSLPTTKTKWWHNLLFWRHRKPGLTSSTPSERELFIAQEQWLQQCEWLAGQYSWIDLKRAILDAPNDLRNQVAFAAKHCQQQAWPQALEWYDGLIEKCGDLTPLLGRRGQLHRQLGNSEAALRDYSRAIEKAPHEAQFWLNRSYIYCDLQAWEQSIRDVDEAIRLTPIDPAIRFHRAQIRLQQNKTSEALDDFHEAIRLDPNFGKAHFHIGWLYSCLHADKGTEAIKHLSQAFSLTLDPNIRLHRGLTYLAQHKFALAMEDCETVLASDPNNALAHGIRGRVLQCEEQFEEAIVACTRAIELGYEHAMVYLARAISYAATDQPTLAALDCEAAIAIEPNNAWASQIQGRLQLQTGDLDAAVNAFHRALELAPDWDAPREQLSLLHRLKENPRASVDEQTLLIGRQPKKASHYVNRAFAYTQLQEYSLAADDYDQAIEIEPENDQLYFLRGVFRMNCQEIELALVDFERVLEITGGNDSARAHRASLLLRLKRYQEAIDDYALLIAKYPENPSAYSGRAFALAALGNSDLAEDDANRVIDMFPESADEIRLSTETANFYRLLQAEEYDSALDAANQLIASQPTQSRGYRLRAHARWEREEYVEAYDDYSRVIEIDGPTSDCLSSRGQVQAELGEWDKALADLDEAVELARKAGQTIVLAYALNGRSLTLAGLARDEESERDFEESVRLCPTNPWVYYHRGIRKFHLGELVDAKVLLELALEFKDPPLSKRKKQRARTVLDKLSSKSEL
jgi:tetratricopeptide (TPR) repeat protein